MCWPLSPTPKKPSETTPGIIASANSGQDRPSYSNWGQHASEQGIINNISYQNYHYDSRSKPLEELERHCSLTAAFDSAARFDPPRCAQSTRLQIIQTIEEWINNDADNAVPATLFWLYGGAGVGKSAIAQSLSEKYQKKKKLAASFFFFRSDPSRNNGDLLIPTLVSHVVRPFDVVSFVDNRIRENPTLFSKRYDIQIQELLIEPLLALNLKGIRALVAHPRLIVIDGLDECQNPDVQCELLRVIGQAIRQIPYPLRFLVTSRPEAHITHVFNHDRDLKTVTVHRYNLSNDPDADMDIHNYLTREFEKIRSVHRLGRHLPHGWPNRNTIISLVERSSGHFIYASTVIRYIESSRHRPDDRLEVILRLRPPQEGDRPFAQLDALYSLIFAGVESTKGQLERVCLVLGVLFFQSKNFPTVRDRTIEELLEMKAGDLELLLDPILSLVSIDGDQVRVLHKSLFDYLLDFDRRGQLPFDLAQVHAVAATYILKRTILEDSMYESGDFRRFAFHCKYSYPSGTLKDYLLSLEVPHPKSFRTTPRILWPDIENLLFSIESCCCALSRKDFDSTGQFYERYMAKWIDYLNSSVPARTKHQSRAADAEVDDLKRKLDTLLMEWKSEKLNTMDVGMRCVDFIKQEHDVFALFAETSTSVIPDAFTSVSSLVFGVHFIHGYNLLIGHKRSFLFARTYSRHENACFRYGFHGDIDAVQKIREYLMMAEKCLFSDLYQMYGIIPE